MPTLAAAGCIDPDTGEHGEVVDELQEAVIQCMDCMHDQSQGQAAGRPIPDEILAGLSALIHEHVNFSARYPFNVPVLDRPLRDLDTPEDEDT
ncbi:MAG: hypothetical protein ACXVII_35910 [Solirubrobacteraceae bacterium]